VPARYYATQSALNAQTSQRNCNSNGISFCVF